MKEDKYTITCTEEELYVIEKCVEVCHRISCGQMDCLNDILPRRITWEETQRLKSMAFPELQRGQCYSWDGGYGQLHNAENKKHAEAYSHFQAITYPIYREILHYFAVKYDKENVYAEETMNCGHGGFIKIERQI